MMEPQGVLDFIYRRRSVRRYRPEPVSREMLLDLVRAASAAPSAVNRQPWAFVIVDDPQRIASCLQVVRFARHGSPAAVVVCGDLSRALPGVACDYWIQDCSAATQNLLLAAAGVGLGAVWCGVYPVEETVRGVRQALGLPDFLVPLNFICVGWPQETPPPRTQFDPGRVVYNAWDPSLASQPRAISLFRLVLDQILPKKG
jgi:nitroreductase